ncbi:unnamed protein product [Clonostachys rosea f. rosea IK726]|uniref:Uncharacterized protein n=1 Tax=Clonostachys rosea f. rosea IK726 TaxID=1349383 RepID=A0ACA9UI98_BIOOC|nr:unnamed protein product [Clonostachys rosea f. rosea IK726]
MWCYDKGHRLSCVRTVYERRAVTQSTNKLCIDESLGLLMWMLSDIHILTLKHATGDVEVSTATGKKEKVQAESLPTIDRDSATTPEPLAQSAMRDNIDTASLAKMTTLSSHKATDPAINVNEMFCDVCLAMLSTSGLFKDGSLWDQRPLEEVLKNVDPSVKKRKRQPKAETEIKGVEENDKGGQMETSVHLNSEIL